MRHRTNYSDLNADPRPAHFVALEKADDPREQGELSAAFDIFLEVFERDSRPHSIANCLPGTTSAFNNEDFPFEFEFDPQSLFGHYLWRLAVFGMENDAHPAEAQGLRPVRW